MLFKRVIHYEKQQANNILRNKSHISRLYHRQRDIQLDNAYSPPNRLHQRGAFKNGNKHRCRHYHAADNIRHRDAQSEKTEKENRRAIPRQRGFQAFKMQQRLLSAPYRGSSYRHNDSGDVFSGIRYLHLRNLRAYIGQKNGITLSHDYLFSYYHTVYGFILLQLYGLLHRMPNLYGSLSAKGDILIR